MKVALIGNMNNNNFSIMRYFRDFGIDAHLILFKDDITKSQSHFKPEFDTWDIDKWSPYIHYVNYNSYYAALFYPAFLLKKYFKGYDILISTGNSPIILNKCGLKIDIFYPYGEGIEGVGDPISREKWINLPFIKRVMYSQLRRLKISAIKKADICLNSDLHLTKETFDELDIPFQKISIPMVYNKELRNIKIRNENIQNLKKKINSYKYKFFCHVSQLPVKNNLPMIEGFIKFALSQKTKNCVLILTEYGSLESINLTKEKLEMLGVIDRVIWLKKTTRRELMYLLGEVDFGFSEFEGTMWGGTGWEFLSAGIPFFHFLNLSPEKFKREFNFSMPPIINTNSSDEIYQHLKNYSENPNPYKKRGVVMKDWFEKYGGIGLAKIWKDIILKIYQEKQINESN
tara:strand:+ start:6455 stop:7657 length:1203 start_codon:yes stop_codon:yes gene_type:complete